MSPRRRAMLAVAAVLAAVLTVAGALAAWGPGPDGDPRVDRSRAGPVLLVPGYGGTTDGLVDLAAWLRVAGRDARVVTPPDGGTGDLREQAGALADAADDALAAGAPSVDVVGYSAGGVVARVWADELDGADVARRVVTLGSPHHGTEVATFAAAALPSSCPPACRQLLDGSDLLAGLPETPPGPAWTSIWTARDDVVVPPESSRLDGAVNVELQQVCPGARADHGDLPTDPLVRGLVARALDETAMTAPPDTTRCAQLLDAGA